MFCKGTWGGGGVTGETAQLRQAGTCSHCPLSSKLPRLARQREDRESCVTCALSACWACPGEGRLRLQCSVTLVLPDSSQPAHLLPELRHQAEESPYLGTPPTMACSLLPSDTRYQRERLTPGWQRAPTTAPSGSSSALLGAELGEAEASRWADAMAPWGSGYSCLLWERVWLPSQLAPPLLLSHPPALPRPARVTGNGHHLQGGETLMLFRKGISCNFFFFYFKSVLNW